MLIVHNEEIANLIKPEYTLDDVQTITALLNTKGSFNFPALDNGLFPAAVVEATTQYTGYAAVWVRDNVHVAYSQYLIGKTDVALATVNCLMRYFQKHKSRFENIINNKVDPNNVMQRPHIRFSGEDLEEIDQSWEHAQNDALGYFLWLYCTLVQENILRPSQQDVETLALFPLYFEAVSYWQDEDSGHWEEDRKIEASSIGAAVAGLKTLKQVSMMPSFISDCCRYGDKLITTELLDSLIQQGLSSLSEILPSECIQAGKERRYDSALLFLIYPLRVLDDAMADQIMQDVTTNLQGDYGISRYPKDSFWCRDYHDIPESIRTSISIEREQWFEANNRALQDGEEAQWCIFDPIISAIYGTKFQTTGKTDYLEKQIWYLNRSLGQLTALDFKLGGFKCPELYYLHHGEYIPNDATPLLWTQANLSTALKMMENSLTSRN